MSLQSPPSSPSSPLSPPSSTSSPSSSSSLSIRNPRQRPKVDDLRCLLDNTLRVHCSDGRVFVGTFVCTDKACNIILSNTDEYRVGGGDNGRYVTMVMIPWPLVVSIGAYENQFN